MHRIYPFQTKISARESDARYKPDPDKATEWLKLILEKEDKNGSEGKSGNCDK
jgi:hypothetical protein